MAFLCPSRLGKAKQKKGYHSSPLGRISGSGSTDTLLNIHLAKKGGLGPEQRMIVLHNFTSYTSEELSVKQGQKVYILYREYDWAYVLTDDKKEGFVPFTYLARVGIAPAVGSPEVKQKSDQESPKSSPGVRASRSKKTPSVGGSDRWENDSSGLGQWSGESVPSSPRSNSSSDTGPEITTAIVEEDEPCSGEHDSFTNRDLSPHLNRNGHGGYSASDDINCRNGFAECADVPMNYAPFRKVNQGDYLVLYDFDGLDESEVTVSAAERVRLLNSEDTSWYWVRTADGLEGFVPRSFLFPISLLQPKDGYRSQRSSMYIESTTTSREPSFSYLFSSSATNGNAPRKLDLTCSNPSYQNVRMRDSGGAKTSRPISYHQGIYPLANSKDTGLLTNHMNLKNNVTSTGDVKPTWAMLASFAGGRMPSGSKSFANKNDVNPYIRDKDNATETTSKPNQDFCANSSVLNNNRISDVVEEADDGTEDQQTTPPESSTCDTRFENAEIDNENENSVRNDNENDRDVQINRENEFDEEKVERHGEDSGIVPEVPDTQDEAEEERLIEERLKTHTDFVAIFDYTAQGSVDLTFSRGEFLQVDLTDQDNEDWYWAFSSRCKRTGYVPRAYVKIAQITVI